MRKERKVLAKICPLFLPYMCQISGGTKKITTIYWSEINKYLNQFFLSILLLPSWYNSLTFHNSLHSTLRSKHMLLQRNNWNVWLHNDWSVWSIIHHYNTFWFQISINGNLFSLPWYFNRPKLKSVPVSLNLAQWFFYIRCHKFALLCFASRRPNSQNSGKNYFLHKFTSVNWNSNDSK